MHLRNPPSGSIVALPSFPSETVTTSPGPAANVNWLKGPAQALVLTGNTVLTSQGLATNEPTWVQLLVVQANGGGHSLTIAGAKTPNGDPIALTAAAGAKDIVSIFWDGVAQYAMLGAPNFL